MRVARVGITLLLIASGWSCMDLSPDRRVMALLSQFQVADSTGASDSLHIRFSASYGSCDKDVTADVIALSGLRSFAVWFTPGTCNAGVGASKQFHFVIPPSQRANPFTLQFRQSGDDNFVTVVWR